MRTFKCRLSIVSIVAVLGAFLFVTPAVSAPITVTWNTCVGSATGVTPPGACDTEGAPDLNPPSGQLAAENPGTTSETKIFQSVSPDTTRLLRARAFRTEGSISPFGELFGTPITIFGGGLGAGGETTEPQHAVDNYGPDELIVFQFARPDYVPKSFRIGFKGNDADIVTYIGGAASNPATNAIDLFTPDDTWTWDPTGANLIGLGYQRQDFNDVAVGVDQIFAPGKEGQFLIIAVFNHSPEASSSNKDAFKIQQIVGVVDEQRVPEASTLMLLVTGAAALTAFARRRR